MIRWKTIYSYSWVDEIPSTHTHPWVWVDGFLPTHLHLPTHKYTSNHDLPWFELCGCVPPVYIMLNNSREALKPEVLSMCWRIFRATGWSHTLCNESTHPGCKAFLKAAWVRWKRPAKTSCSETRRWLASVKTPSSIWILECPAYSLASRLQLNVFGASRLQFRKCWSGMTRAEKTLTASCAIAVAFSSGTMNIMDLNLGLPHAPRDAST